MTHATSVLFDCDARGVATLTLNRPDKRNAFDGALIAELHAAIERATNDAAVRVIVLTGSGNTFCAGMDLDHMRLQGTKSERDNIDDALRFARCLQALDELPKPVIARVNGGAYGGGLGLIACADIAIGSAAAKFALTEVRLGIVPAVISPYVVAAIGARHARRWFLSGGQLDAEQARQIGLLHEAAAPELLEVSIEREVALLLQGGPLAQGEAKRLVREVGSIHGDVHEHTAKLLARLRASPEGQEGLRAFNEKRKPGWSK
jgi:methylglutaconyl-CoA hydratase